MKNKYHERLKYLAQHLQTGKLKTKVEIIIDDPTVDDTSDYVEETIPYFVYPIKELPYIFSDWRMDKQGNPFWAKDENKNPVSSALYFFDFSFDIFQHLFIPGAQNIEWYGGKVLTKTASPEEIAHNMLELIKRVE